ncbi:MAG: ABC transporter ATP-binding protein [Nanoarchaeota archaeon]|nr:ABC transporter ATP-binding protein [Nanoarchaeota archaeon]
MVSQKRIQYPIKTFSKDMWNFLEGNRFKYIFFIMIRICSEAIPFVIAYFLGLTIDFFTVYEKGQSLSKFYLYVSAIGVLGMVQVWSRMFAKLNSSIIGAKTRQKVRELSISKLIDLELEWHEKEGSGSKIQKINQGSMYVYKFFSDFTNNRSLSTLVGIIGSLTIFFVLGWKYAIFSIIYTSIFLNMEYYFNKKLSYWNNEMHKISEKISGKIHESASNVLSVKALGLRNVFQESTKGDEVEYYKIWLSMKKTGNAKMNVSKTFAALGYALFLLLVGLDFSEGIITLGSILIFAAYFDKLRSSLNDVSEMVDGFIEIKSGVGRLMTILGVDVFNKESNDLLEVPLNWQKIEFKNVNFNYSHKEVLKNFNLVIKRGEKIGVVGSSGCGKSTLTKLLLGLYDIKSGGIYIDGKNINKFKHSSITNNLTPVLQDSEMFDMTLAENIAISSSSRSKILLLKSIRISSLNSVINKLPKGLSTLLGEKGYKVSGGERQRIGIARAVYKNSPMLILDEATSHLDSKTEQYIQKQLEKELTDKTLLIIAHRLSTLKGVDRIIVMENGKIVEEGKFSDLIMKRQKFYKFYQLQNNIENQRSSK